MAFNSDALTPEFFLNLGSGLLSGNTWNEQLGNASANTATTMAAQKQKQQADLQLKTTADWLADKDPQLSAMVRNGSVTPVDAYKSYNEKILSDKKAAQPKYNFMNVNGRLIRTDDTSGSFNELGNFPDQQSAENNLGLNPQYGVDKDGNPVLLQLGKDGKVVQSALPEGVTLSKAPIKLDAGTHFVLLDPITRQPVGTIPKNIAEVEKQKVLGENEGKNTAAAPADLQAGLNAKALIEELKTDPNREMGTGLSGYLLNGIPSSSGYDYQNKVDQAKSGAFLTAIQQLRGMGSLSNAEGETATKAITRMNTSTSEEAFLDALDEYEKIIDQGIARAESRLPSSVNSQIPSVNPTGMNTTTTGIPWKKK